MLTALCFVIGCVLWGHFTSWIIKFFIDEIRVIYCQGFPDKHPKTEPCALENQIKTHQQYLDEPLVHDEDLQDPDLVSPEFPDFKDPNLVYPKFLDPTTEENQIEIDKKQYFDRPLNEYYIKSGHNS
jgi:hypothetical protein